MKNNLDISLDHLGVIVVDMQKCFLNTTTAKVRRELISSQTEILKLCRNYDYPTIVLEYYSPCYGKTVGDLVQIINEIPRKIVLEKLGVDGFKINSLPYYIDRWGIESAIFMGVNGQMCVKKTASSAIDRGLTILTAKKLINTQEGLEKEFSESLPWFRSNGIYFDNYRSLLDLMKEKNQIRREITI